MQVPCAELPPSPHSCGHSLTVMGLREQNLSGPAGGSHNPPSPGGTPAAGSIPLFAWAERSKLAVEGEESSMDPSTAALLAHRVT